ncbi:hypothetical protein AB840_03065 [Megasphaera cerevisiae DSM 20462]|jgi:twitching motility protein PilT|uniref:AAA+ ATPase domain-containing protein n=1 Tax=Megasphaera cerevisiae DSM 20462 TaxID=1122219 RepID=A0A0J6WYP3_9FIRM|nr:ATPase, T2SS/T4P/T4SS family [Megasphaera cerevisiae]KMO87383.1 hypothetical protein AB840_03065 [Megasphaera cerevisiae DSM 20462]MCI1749890.1 Flp pilus assembly complex ATPase component TadA [Megasphaera cerevisiae]OKY54818.1 hypothetical protein BSR42_00475 [Megasphaera cerevisiae]SJZ38761.1 twitching motility protein PilT [Megasphaera cerevisiae DSM 20462]
MNVCEVLSRAIEKKAADIHLQEGRPPFFRLVRGLFHDGNIAVTRHDIDVWLQSVGGSCELTAAGSLAFSWNKSVRCRVQVCREYAGLHVVIRILYPLDTLPPDRDEALFRQLGDLEDGLVLVCGATGSGKTTTIWQILQYVNQRKPCHIITLEDPVEYVLSGEKALITQRERLRHFQGFGEGVQEALRQDPDILFVGEMRDKETMNAAITAAETGHLVLSTLHTRSAAQAVSRLAGAYPGDEQDELRCRLALVLQAIVAQQRGYDGEELYIIREILLHSPAVAQLIRSGREHQLPTVMQTGTALGMRTMEQAIQQFRRRS